jgi:hypothetical protein
MLLANTVGLNQIFWYLFLKVNICIICNKLINKYLMHIKLIIAGDAPVHIYLKLV